MVFIDYKVKGQKDKLKFFLRERIKLNNKIRYHKIKIRELEEKLEEVNNNLRCFLDKFKD